MTVRREITTPRRETEGRARRSAGTADWRVQQKRS